MYTAFDSDAASWSFAFYDEAVQLWEEDCVLGLMTPVTVAVLLYLSMSAMCHAKSKTDTTRYLDSAINLACRIGLFGVGGERTEESWPNDAADALWQKAMAQTAWGSFVYIT